LEQRIEAGERAPHFGLLAAGSGRRVSLDGMAGRRIVLIFHLQGTAPTAREINRAVRDRHPSPDDVLIASVVDLSMVPPVYWLTLGLVLSSAYERVVREESPPGVDPADYVIICPDWGGLVSRKYRARETGRAAVIVVINKDSNIAGSYQGERPVEAVLGMLDGG
jgi:hypothetical protein